eukprot:TRINITY_DN1221_c0_g1_i2.p1 TRINITY_DN1221_c0_g1~~TRINITY_DN1221_c0_g1_i2.p1  ORF type:complete len:906 (-),score=187.40 TRINITY_DN1221_c0_g1_i2:38-2644(-)
MDARRNRHQRPTGRRGRDVSVDRDDDEGQGHEHEISYARVPPQIPSPRMSRDAPTSSPRSRSDGTGMDRGNPYLYKLNDINSSSGSFVVGIEPEDEDEDEDDDEDEDSSDSSDTSSMKMPGRSGRYATDDDLDYDQTVFGQFRTNQSEHAQEIAYQMRQQSLSKRRGQVQRYRKNKLKEVALKRGVRGWFYFLILKASDHTYTTVFLVVMAVTAGLIGFGIDVAVRYLLSTRVLLQDLVPSAPLSLLPWVAWVMVFTLAAMLVMRYVSLLAVGSGIPELKSILSGKVMNQYLSVRTGVAKAIGLILALGSGLFTGKEGPFVHISGVICNFYTNRTLFESIRLNEALKQQMLAAAVAVGVASTFGSPIGGTLFSIEVTSTYYPIRNYWYATFGAMWGGLMIRMLKSVVFRGELGFGALIQVNGSINGSDFTVIDIVIFALMGFVLGAAGALFTWFSRFLVDFRRKYAKKTKQKWIAWMLVNPFFYGLSVAGLTGILSYPFFLGTEYSVRNLISVTELVSDELPSSWFDLGGLYMNLILFTIIRFSLTNISMSIQIPTGLYAPIIVIGCALGRLLGESLNQISGTLFAHPASYALVGGGAFAAGVTQTLSSAVIMVELTGSIEHLMPLLIGVVFAMGTSQKLIPSVYDVIAGLKNLPFLPDLRHSKYDMSAAAIMSKDIAFLTPLTDVDTIAYILKNQDDESFAVINDNEEMYYLGTIDRWQLDNVVLDAAVAKHSMKEQAKRDPFGPKNPDPDDKDKDNQETWGPDDVRKRKKKLSQSLKLSEDGNFDFLEDVIHSPATVRQKVIELDYNPSNITLAPDTNITVIHQLFIVMRWSSVYVTDNGILKGRITRQMLTNVINSKKKKDEWKE